MRSSSSILVLAVTLALAACGDTPQLGSTDQAVIAQSPVSAAIGNVAVNTTSAPVSTRIFVNSGGIQGDNVLSVTENCANFVPDLGTQTLPHYIYRFMAQGEPVEMEDFTLLVRFTPTVRGPQTCIITIDMESTADRTFTVTGTGIAPELTIDTGALAFGGVRVGASSAPQTVTISNTGDTTLTLAPPSASSQYALSGLGAMTLVPGGSLTLSVTFQPTAQGSQPGTLTITGNDPVDGDEVVSLSGTGLRALATLGPATLTFPGTPVGGSSTADATASNPGNASLSVATVTITGADASQFSLVTGTSFSVAGGATQPVTVRCAPTSPGTKTATLTIVTDADAAPTNPSIALSCPSVAPNIAVSLGALDFGAVHVATPSTQGFQISNTGGAALTGTLARSGGAAGDFAVTPASINLGPGQSTTAMVTFTPSVNGPRSTTIVISSNDPDSPAVNVAASGVGTTTDLIQTMPIGGTLAFGGVPVDATSATATVEVRNVGNVPIAISGAGLVGANPTDFTVVTGPGTVMLAGGESASWTLACHPSSAGVKAATFQYPSNDPGGPSSIALTCTGLQTALSITPLSPIDFGSVRVGQLSAAVPITLRNTGNSIVTINSVTLGAAVFELVAPVMPTLPTTLEPNGIATLSVVFRPATEGTVQADLTVVYDGSQSIAYTLSGSAVVPRATATPTTLSFGPVCIGQPRTLTLTLGNLAGTGPFKITAATSSNPAFVVTPVGPATVPGEVATDVPGLTFSIPVSASGLDGGVGLGPIDTDFGDVVVGQASAARTVTLTNCGAGPVSLASLELGGPDALDFQITDAPTLPVTVEATASVQLVFGFTPSRAGVATATLTATHDGDGSPATATLHGTGTVESTPDGGDAGGRDATSYYACSSGGPGAAAPIGLALLALVGLTRRRRIRVG